MTTILEENRKYLRPAMRVECGFRETDEEPTNITPIGADPVYFGLENLDRDMITVVLMDLAGDGFANTGDAVPMETDTDSFRYGYISEAVANADGTFSTPFGLTIESPTRWQNVTLEVMDQAGNSEVIIFNPVWGVGQTTIYIDKFTPGERAYIVGVYLGKAWLWNNSSLLSVNVDLRSVSTEIGGELEASTIEIQAYEPTDYTDIIGQIPIGAPIWYAAGYIGDISRLRRFYLSEVVTWDDNVLTIRGQDATMLLDNVEIPVDCDNYGAGWEMDHVIGKRIRAALAPIDYDEIGGPPEIEAQSLQVVLYDAKAARSIISEYTGIFRDGNYYRATYVDAGRPTLSFADYLRNWTIYADEIADFNIIVEQNKKTLRITLPEYYLQYNDEIEKVKTTSGKTYFVTLDPPVPANNVSITPTPTSSEEINCSKFKFVAAASTTYTIKGYETLSNLVSGNNPYSASETNAGETFTFDFELPLFYDTGGVSITKESIKHLLERSNVLYEFTYRGNPHIQPRDVLNVEVANWIDYDKTIDGLYPETDLYPATDLYPHGEYKKARKMVKKWVTMTVDSVSLEHAEGGLTSKIIARKGAV